MAQEYDQGVDYQDGGNNQSIQDGGDSYQYDQDGGDDQNVQYDQDGGDNYQYDQYDQGEEAAATSVFGATSIGILGLFAFLIFMGIRSNSGSVCNRGALAFLMLPIASAVMYGLLKKAFTPTVGLSDELGKAQGFLGRLAKGTAGGGSSGNLSRIFSMATFALFMAFIQYLVTAVIVMFQKPDVPKTVVFKKSFIAFGISFIFSIIFIVAFTLVTNLIPPVKAVFTIGSRLPIIGSFINQGAYMILATSPIAMLASWGAHGIACSAM